MSVETLALGRAKRSTAGNRMRELLEKAHQEDEKDELFAEEADDDEFEAPQDIRDVFLDEFADTDEEVEMDEEAEEREIRREERRNAKGKGKSAYNPLTAPRTAAPPKQTRFAEPSSSTSPAPESSKAEALALLDPSLDPYTMAPTTVALLLRRQRREAKRAERNESRRSSMRASTLRTEAEIIEKEMQEKLNPSKKGRRAQHETGEIRGKRNMTQDQLIAAALEEEERNKEALRDWVRREEERRELRRVGRKRVKGPRWSWVSRTVGKLVEVVGEEGVQRERAGLSETPLIAEVGQASEISRDVSKQTDGAWAPEDTGLIDGVAPAASGDSPVKSESQTEQPGEPSMSASIVLVKKDEAVGTVVSPPKPADQSEKSENLQITSLQQDGQSPSAVANSADPIAVSSTGSLLRDENPSAGKLAEAPDPAALPPAANDGPTGPYTRNYIILSQIPGGLPAEWQVVLGDHVEWDQVKVIPARNRPINRRPPICQFTGQIAKYRHPATMIPYATVEGYKQVDALLRHRYVWSDEARCWFGGEDDVCAEGMDESLLRDWSEKVHGGWSAGKEVPVALPVVDDVKEEEEEEAAEGPVDQGVIEESIEVVEVHRSVKPGKTKPKGSGKGKRKSDVAEAGMAETPPPKKGKAGAKSRK